MIGRGIAAMDGKTILGKLPVEFLHDPISGHLGQDTGGGNTQTETISPNESGLLHRKAPCRKTIHEDMGGRMSVFHKTFQSATHGEMGCPQDIQMTDFL